MRTSCFWCNYHSLLLPFSFLLLSLHSLFLHSLFFRSLFCLLSSSFHTFCLSLSLVAHPLYSSVLLSFPLPPIVIWEDMRRKWEKSTEKWHIFFQNLLFDKSTFQNWIESYRSTQRPSRALYSFSDFYIIPCLSVFLNFRWCSAEGDIIHSSHCGKLPPRAHVRAPYSNFALFAFTTFTLAPFICLNFPLISRHYPPKISHVFSKNSDVFGEISHVFSKTSESCG